MKTKSKSLGITAPYILTMRGGRPEVLRNGYIEIQGSTIVFVGASDKGRKPSKRLKLADHVVMPGLINSHTHLAMTLFRGLADDLPFAEWLFKTILPLEQKMVDRNFVKVGTELAAAELIRHGVTTAVDMYFYADEIARSYGKAGLRGVITQGTIDFPSPEKWEDSSTLEPALKRLLSITKKYPRLTAGLGPHAPYSCSDERLRLVADLRDRYQIPISIHVGETRAEVEESHKKYGMSPFARMERLGITGPTSIFAHCVHATDADIEILARTKTGVSHCPESNMKLGAGICPVPKLLARGVKVGLGTDSVASNNNLNLLNECDVAAKLQKLANGDNTAMTAATALRLATLGNAEVLGMADSIGSLEVGKEADLIAVDLNHPHLTPMHDIVSTLVYSATSLEVSLTMCGGEILYQDGKFKTLKWPKVRKAAESLAKRMALPGQAALKSQPKASANQKLSGSDRPLDAG